MKCNGFTGKLLICICCLLILHPVDGKGGEDTRAVQSAIHYATTTLNNSNSTINERTEAFRKLSEHDHISGAVFVLSYLKKITKSMKYNYMVSQAQRKNVLCMYEILEIEKVISSYRDERILKTVLMNLKKMPEVGKLTLLQGLKGTPSGDLDLYYLKLIRDRRTEPKERIIAIEAAGLRKLKEALPVLQRMAADGKEPFRIRCTALRSLAKIPDKSSIEPLLKLRTEKGRIGAEARNALLSLTEEEISTGMKGEQWWADIKDEFEPPEVPVSHENSELKEQQICEFYGIPLIGKKVMFILDRSGSMRDDDKIEGVKAKVVSIAEKFDSETWFNLMFFNEGTNLWYQQKPYIKKVDDRLESSLWSFLLTITPDGGTFTENAMHETLVKLNTYAGFETVFLLSDGLPNNDPSFLLYSVYHINRYMKVRINTVFISETGQENISASSDTMVGNLLDREMTAATLMGGISGMNDGIFVNITPQQAKQK